MRMAVGRVTACGVRVRCRSKQTPDESVRDTVVQRHGVRRSIESLYVRQRHSVRRVREKQYKRREEKRNHAPMPWAVRVVFVAIP